MAYGTYPIFIGDVILTVYAYDENNLVFPYRSARKTRPP